jgi:hypothetical protein
MNMKHVIACFRVTIETNHAARYKKLSYVLGHERAVSPYFSIYFISCRHEQYFNIDI